MNARRKHWRGQGSAKKRRIYLEKHLIPVILGPNEEHYIIDHHHLALALHKEGLKKLYVFVVADLSALDDDTFWFVLDQKDWMHPFDATGARAEAARAIPKSVERMEDDPFRSLWRANCAAWGAMPRTPRPSANSSGPISCARGSRKRLLEKEFHLRAGAWD